ncbi:unnamed protein product [Adineta steineri]|uniref:Uncharacterized protein n=1 Tax=Adineta steineri TaxID=433720 RepID=A0A814E2U6_9BILA|nr:unnamed protein product [Adineta steineri]CAF3498460.1 unnamed protein product [Adineta steineri]
MNNQYKTQITIFLIALSLIIHSLLMKRSEITITHSSQILIMNLYVYAHNLSINGQIDPPCSRTQNIYVCSGYCPWNNTHNNELVSCSFLHRIPNADFVKYNIYCTPEPDHCPTYNAWLKDSLPPTYDFIKYIPDELLSNFTLNYSIRVNYANQEFRHSVSLPVKWTNEIIRKYQTQLRQRVKYGSYTNNDTYLVLDKYASLAVTNKKCAVIGSEDPWIEAALLEYNASNVTTIEYGTIHSDISRLTTITPMDFAKKQANGQELFDSVWSYSSLEHDGLGRYRDPLNAYGDLQTMTKITCILKPGGFFFLGLPINVEDSIAFNLHRVYGPIRLPLIYRYYHVVELLGVGMAKKPGSWITQHFVVLQNKIGCKRS